ncbi:MAG: hypothetical protein U0359_18745 [Byssovorax sp.]
MRRSSPLFAAAAMALALAGAASMLTPGCGGGTGASASSTTSGAGGQGSTASATGTTGAGGGGFDPTGHWTFGAPSKQITASVQRSKGDPAGPATLDASADPDSGTDVFAAPFEVELDDPSTVLLSFTYDFFIDLALDAARKGGVNGVDFRVTPLGASGCNRRTIYSLDAAFPDASHAALTLREHMEYLPRGPACAAYLAGALADPSGDPLFSALAKANLLGGEGDLVSIDLAYQVPATRAETLVHSIPRCDADGPKLAFSPIADPSSEGAIDQGVEALGPLGNYAPSGHIYPTPILYLYPRHEPQNFSKPIPVPAFAPADLKVYRVERNGRYADPGYTKLLNTDVQLDFALCREVRGFIALVQDPAPAVQALLGPEGSTEGYQCQDMHNGPYYYRSCRKDLDFVTLPAGTLLGEAGLAGDSAETSIFALDFALLDRRVPHIVADHGLMIGWGSHTVCPLDYYPPGSLRNALKNKLGRVDGTEAFKPSSSCGSAYWDVPGTARGVWIDPDRLQPTQDRNITLAAWDYDNTIGAFALGEGVRRRLPRRIPRRRRAPRPPRLALHPEERRDRRRQPALRAGRAGRAGHRLLRGAARSVVHRRRLGARRGDLRAGRGRRDAAPRGDVRIVQLPAAGRARVHRGGAHLQALTPARGQASTRAFTRYWSVPM